MKRVPAVVVAASFVSSRAWALCPMCKKALEESGSGLVAGFYWSIILLCVIPLAVFALAGWKYKQLKQKADAV